MAVWYYSNEDQQIGPHSKEEFDALVEDGTITGSTLVWHTGMKDWQSYETIADPAPEKIVEEQDDDTISVAKESGEGMDFTNASAGDTEAGMAICTECKNSFPETQLIQHNQSQVCINCKPVFLQKLQEGVKTNSPSFQNGMNGNYDFQIMEVIKEAWSMTSGMKLPAIGVFLIVIAASGGLNLGSTFLLPMLGAEDSTIVIVGMGIVQLIVQLTIYIISAGAIMAGVRRAADFSVGFGTFFSYFKFSFSIIVANILMALMILLGFLFLVIPGIYLSIAYALTIPLMLEKGMSPWQAMEASRKAITHKWFKFFGLYFVMGFYTGLSAIPIGIGLIWTIPTFIIVIGIAYREVFGIENDV
jgi:hypothetical protein